MRYPIAPALLLATLAGLAAAPPVRADFALRDGDTVVFLGDSITAARTYGKIVENYTLLRYPGRHVRFINSGWGGDTAAGGLKRLDRDVFAHGATVLIVAYGVNDIGWGTKADEEHRQIYLEAVRGIVEACKPRHVRVFLCSAAATAEDPDTAEAGFLQKMCDDGMALAREMGEGAIDVQRTMRAIQRKVRSAAESTKDPKDRPTLHAPDGIHLNDLGQLAMAFAILKGLGASPEVSAATIDLHDSQNPLAEGCTVTNVHAAANHVEFDRLDEGLPVNFGVFGALQFRFVPVPDELNRYMLTVKNLPDGPYTLHADDRPLGTFTAKQLAEGVNICSATADGWEPGGPWDAQAALLIRLTDARDDVAQTLRLTDHYLPAHPDREALRRDAEEANARLVSYQRALVKPRPFHFGIRPAPPKAP